MPSDKRDTASSPDAPLLQVPTDQGRQQRVPDPDSTGVGASKQQRIEPYHPTYLAALKDEGIDLPRFIVRWRESAYDDIARLQDAMRTADILSAKRVLHSLSGTAGLVGAVPLAEALHAASAGVEVRTNDVVALISRLNILIGQLRDVTVLPVKDYDSPSRPD